MPNFAVIKSDGTGDYATVEAFRAAEIKSNYGEMTIGVVDGLVNAGGTLLFHKAASDDWPHGVGLIAADGQVYDGSNLSTCARISHSSSIIELGDTDLFLSGLYVIPTGSYNVKTFRFAASYQTTQRRTLEIKKCAFATSPNYHGTTAALYFTLVSGNANSQYELDIEDVVLIPRASNDALTIAALSGTLDISGTINRLTVANTNTSGSSAQESMYLGPGSSCTLAVDNVLLLGSQGRTNYIDYTNAGFSGTVGTVVTADGTGTITGATAAAELENPATSDYRLKSTSQGYGAFPQISDPGTPSSYDIGGTGSVSISASGWCSLEFQSGGDGAYDIVGSGAASVIADIFGESSADISGEGGAVLSFESGGNGYIYFSGSGGVESESELSIGGSGDFSLGGSGSAELLISVGGIDSIEFAQDGSASVVVNTGGSSSLDIDGSGSAYASVIACGLGSMQISGFGGVTVNEQAVVIGSIGMPSSKINANTNMPLSAVLESIKIPAKISYRRTL